MTSTKCSTKIQGSRCLIDVYTILFISAKRTVNGSSYFVPLVCFVCANLQGRDAWYVGNPRSSLPCASVRVVMGLLNGVLGNIMFEPDYGRRAATKLSQVEEASKARQKEETSRARQNEEASKARQKEEASKARQRWLYCIGVGCILVVLVIILFGAIIWVQYHRQLPTFNVVGGVVTNYRIVDGRPASSMTFNLTCENPGDQVFKISSGKLELMLNFGRETYTIAVVETEGFKLQGHQRRQFSGYVRDTEWQIPLDSVEQVKQRLTSEPGLPVALHGLIDTHYAASKVLMNISRTVKKEPTEGKQLVCEAYELVKAEILFLGSTLLIRGS